MSAGFLAVSLIAAGALLLLVRWQAGRRAEGHFRALIGLMPEAVLLCDEEGRILFSNHQAVILLQTAPSGGRLGIPLQAGPWVDLDLPRKNGKSASVEMRSQPIEWQRRKAWLVTMRDVTKVREAERAKSQEALQESEERYGAVYESSPDALALCFPPEWKISSPNPAAVRILGAANPEDVSRLALSDLEKPSKGSGGADPDLTMTAMVSRALENGSATSEKLLRRADGKVFTAIVVMARIELEGHTGVLANIRDISERKVTELRLLESETQLSNALQLAKAGQWIYDADSDLFIFNDNFYRIFGTTAQSVGGYRMTPRDYARRFLPLEDRPVVARELAAALDPAGGKTSGAFEHRFIQTDGTTGYLAVRFRVERNGGGKAVRLLGVSQDITGQTEQAQTIKEKETLIQEIHHRVKNNLQVVSGLLSLQLRGQTGDAVRSQLRTALARISSVALLHELIYRAQDLHSVPLLALTRELTAKLQDMYRETGCSITFDLDVDQRITLPEELSGPVALIVNELLTNSCKHAFVGLEEGHVSITAETAGDSGAQAVTLRISDNGVGRPPEEANAKQEGLGSKIIQRLTRQIGGSIEYLPRKKGSCSVLRFEINAIPS